GLGLQIQPVEGLTAVILFPLPVLTACLTVLTLLGEKLLLCADGA
ncbi:hypothetical protein Tco_0470424, partial [Tanacetum coccineum]